MKPIKCKTQWHIIVAYLWQQKTWMPTHSLQSVRTDFGFIGSSGEQRVRELARNDDCIPEDLRDKIEKRRNGKYEEFRYVARSAQYARVATEMCRRFDAGLSAEQVFAV